MLPASVRPVKTKAFVPPTPKSSVAFPLMVRLPTAWELLLSARVVPAARVRFPAWASVLLWPSWRVPPLTVVPPK